MAFFKKSAVALVVSLLFSFNSWATSFSTPEEAVNSYITAVKTGSGPHIVKAFQATARIQYYDQDGKLNNFTRAEFEKLVNTGNQWDANITITNMLLTDKVANATVEFTWGENSEHGYTDYLNLLFDGESWRITNKVAVYISRK